MKKSTRIGVLLAIVVVAAAAALLEWLVLRDPDVTKAPSGIIANVELGGPFTLISATSRWFSSATPFVPTSAPPSWATSRWRSMSWATIR
jgi:hypothetical protein